MTQNKIVSEIKDALDKLTKELELNQYFLDSDHIVSEMIPQTKEKIKTLNTSINTLTAVQKFIDTGGWMPISEYDYEKHGRICYIKIPDYENGSENVMLAEYDLFFQEEYGSPIKLGWVFMNKLCENPTHFMPDLTQRFIEFIKEGK